MFSALIRLFLLVICLGANQFALASSHVENMPVSPMINTHEQTLITPLILKSNNVAPVSLHITDIEYVTIVDHSLPVNNAPTRTLNWLHGLPLGTNTLRLLWHIPQPINDKLPLHHGRHGSELVDLQVVVNTSMRFLNALHHNVEEVSPYYELVFELPQLPIPKLSVGYIEPLSPEVNWILNTKSTSSRLAGWKESNLIYSRYGHQFARV